MAPSADAARARDAPEVPEAGPAPIGVEPDELDAAASAGRSAFAGAAPVGALALLAGLALWGLGRRSLWVDEAISVGATNELVATWKGTGGTMALYYALLAPWSQISIHPFWLRSLSLAFALVAIPIVWDVARRTFDRGVAAWATLLTAGSWLVVRYAQEARAYSLVLLLTSLSWLALVAAIQADDPAERRRWWRAYAVATVLSPLAHGLAILQFVGQVAFLALGPARREWLERLKPIVLALVAVMSVLVIAGASDVASWIPPVSASQLGDLVGALTGPPAPAQVVLGAAVVAGAVVALRRSSRAEDDRTRWLSLLPLCWGLLPVALLLVVSFARPYLLARYVVGSAPGIGLLLALAIVGTAPRPHLLRAAAVGAAVAGALVLAQVDLHRAPGDDWAGAAAAVAYEARPGDSIVFPNPSVRSAFDHAWLEEVGPDAPSGPAQTTPTAVSPIEPIGDLRRFYLILEPSTLPRQVADTDHDRIWVVDQEGIGFEDSLTPFLDDPAIAEQFVVAGRTELDGGLGVVLLERR
jgi:hypothetical protein